MKKLMYKKLGFAACLVGIFVLHSYIFSSTNSNFSRTNSTNNVGQKDGQKQSNPQFSGVIFAGGEANLIPPTDKQQRQALLNATINAEINADRDPFAAIPGTFAVPPALPQPAAFDPPAPRIPRVASPQPAPPPPVQVQAPALVAEQIRVTGAMEIGGKTYAIVSVPGSYSSQVVTEGERLAGKVLVKSIDLSDRPVVILEQNNEKFTHTIDQS